MGPGFFKFLLSGGGEIRPFIEGILTYLTPQVAAPVCRKAFEDEKRRGTFPALERHAAALQAKLKAGDAQGAGDALAQILGEIAID